MSISPTADVSGLADAAAEGTLTPEQQRIYIAYLAALATEYRSGFHLDDYRRGSVTQHWDLLLGCHPADDAARQTNGVVVGRSPFMAFNGSDHLLRTNIAVVPLLAAPTPTAASAA